MKPIKRNEATKFFTSLFNGEPFVAMTFKPAKIGVFYDSDKLDRALSIKSIQRFYISLNRVSEEVLEGLPTDCFGKMEKGQGIKGTDITHYVYLLVDIDVVGLSGEDGIKRNATEKEHAQAYEVAKQAKSYLSRLGFPEPVVIDSCNGYHVLYKLSPLSTNPEHQSLIKQAVTALAAKVDTDTAKIDTVVTDPGRKLKVPGSANQLEQGNTRFSKIVELPDKLQEVTKEQLKRLADSGSGKSRGGCYSPSDESEKETIADVAESIGEYFMSDTGQVFGNIRISDTQIVTMNILSNDYRLVLRKAIKDIIKIRTLSNDTWKALIDYLEVLASETQVIKKIYNRIGRDEEAIYYDMEDNCYRSVRMTNVGWEIVPTPPGIFQRVDLDKPQIEPECDDDMDYFGTLGELFNLRTRREVELLGIWLISCFIPDIAKPLVLFSGAHATGKSTACTMLQELISPQTMTRSAFPKKVDDLVIRLANRCLCFWDNCERISADASALLCQCITGGNYEKRKLYTDMTLVSIPLKSMILMNSCESILEKPDILSRTLQFNLAAIDGQRMRDDESMRRLFEERKPYLLGYIFECVARFLGIQDDWNDEIHYVTRMTDFQKVATQIAVSCFDKDAEYIEELLKDNKHAIDVQVLESNSVAVLMIDFMENRSSWEGSVTELYDQLDQLAFERGIEKSNKLYPRHAASLSMRLNSIVSMLKNVGITFSIRPEGSYKKIYIKKATRKTVRRHDKRR